MKTFRNRRLLLVPCILQILAAIDEMQDRTTRRCTNNKRPRTDRLEESTPSQRIRRASCTNLDFLHGELSDQEESKLFSTLQQQQQRRYPKSASKPTMKEVLAAEVNDNMHFCSEKDKDIDRLQTKCIKVFLSTAGQNSPQDCNVSALAILHSVLDTASRYPNSPSIRLCSILLVNQNEELDMMQLSNLLWSRALNDPFVLRWYSEVLVECSYFDNHVRLWDAFLPLRNHLREYYKKKNSDIEVVPLRPYLRCFAFLLSKRGARCSNSSQAFAP